MVEVGQFFDLKINWFHILKKEAVPESVLKAIGAGDSNRTGS